MNDGTRGSSKRAFLAGAAAVAGTALAGCGGLASSSGGGSTPTARDVSLSAPTKGPEDAPVTVGVYKDFACPACRQFNEQVAPQIEREYVDQGVVRYEHYDFPLDTHAPVSYTAANAARAVQHEADDAAFFDYADLLFDNQGEFGPSTYADLAGEVDVDGERARSAAEGRTYRRVVGEDKQQGIDAGVRGTPWVFVNGSAVDGFGWETVRSAIESARSDG
ncbi:DSBA oxidoreductase [Halosimplex carlsbadense 2-9-1]|uniref:DSBA oxidoreductase n=1 Tax=Halosimplex carlsbadense 2-9-1 TaxID=797114 RepID=M0CR17_9EURY|nr:thioredoxin domain-containing protein [Halosimplex carlsbadense]ELZ24329.1 DSBA oxidoreductase [Halosimplex carlsbadense 2-9-1]